MRIKTDAVGQIVARPEEHPWLHRVSEEDDDDVEVITPSSLWEAEITALDGDYMQTLQESVEDD